MILLSILAALGDDIAVGIGIGALLLILIATILF